ncbi:F-box protein [Hortaea werneckii]|nr:F-box protein [Hortaea werneckii]KAI7606981.1 F-box protein [Hortaea werneckii]
MVATKLIDRDDFLDPAVKEKKRFEQMLDERVAAGLNKGIDVLMDEVEFICASTQVATDFNPGAAGEKNGGAGVVDIGPSRTAKQVVDTVQSHTSMLVGSTDKNMLDVFTQEVGLRLFGALCKHIKRQRISVDGAIKLISDINHYSGFVTSLRQKPLMPYFQALRELGQIYLVHIDPPAAYFSANAKGKRGSLLSTKGSSTSAQAKELAAIIADTQRYHGIFPAEEVYEFAERRADWYLVKGDVERAMYGVGCSVM